MKPRIKVLVKPGCHLCEDAIKVITEVSEELNETFEVVEIQDNPELMQKYAEEIPVTFVDEKQHDFWRVDKERLKKALLNV
ncbi:MAG: glutaredoxin family protein [Candidatus Nanopelagicales bacterium]|nr:glutaredoxin family protein [Actinomycetota bacterium]